MSKKPYHILPELDYDMNDENNIKGENKRICDLTVKDIMEMTKNGLTVIITNTPNGPSIIFANSISEFIEKLVEIKSFSPTRKNFSEEDIDPIVKRDRKKDSKKSANPNMNLW